MTTDKTPATLAVDVLEVRCHNCGERFDASREPSIVIEVVRYFGGGCCDRCCSVAEAHNTALARVKGESA